MAILTERTVHLLDNIQADGVFTLVSIKQVLRDGEVLFQDKPHRQPVNPGDDLAEMPAIAQQWASVAWTPEIIQAWAEKIAAQRAAAEAGAPL